MQGSKHGKPGVPTLISAAQGMGPTYFTRKEPMMAPPIWAAQYPKARTMLSFLVIKNACTWWSSAGQLWLSEETARLARGNAQGLYADLYASYVSPLCRQPRNLVRQIRSPTKHEHLSAVLLEADMWFALTDRAACCARQSDAATAAGRRKHATNTEAYHCHGRVQVSACSTGT